MYSGWRISELLNLKTADVDLQAGTMKGGTKTKAGKNRVVPRSVPW
jgi:integrase